MSTLTPPSYLDMHSENYYEIVKLAKEDHEYQLIEKNFLSTVSKNERVDAGILGGKFKRGLNEENLTGIKTKYKITSIEKVYNTHIFSRFCHELQVMLQKHPNMKISDMLKHLYCGTDSNDPRKIW